MSMVLSDILYKVHITALHGSTHIAVMGVCIDSRKVIKGSMFVALRGENQDGHLYIPIAIENGATSILCEELPMLLQEGVTYVQVKDTSYAVGIAAHNFYGNPTQKLIVAGVTGTNGKTTVATLAYKLFQALGYTCGLVSTVENRVDDKVLLATHTTPDAVSLAILFHTMVQAGCTHVFMEVSSHAIVQNRIAGVHFAVGIFTNITHDHLDFHKTFENYIKAKKSFFDALPATAIAISNLDDKRGVVMLQNTMAKKQYYSLKTLADYRGKVLDNSLMGLQLVVDDKEVHFRLIGDFNAYNLLAIYGLALSLGEDRDEVLKQMSRLTGAEGRFDYSVSTHAHIVAIVDYAHTPDALQNVLETIKKLKKGFEKIITVVGCGGDRDKTKRPLMARIACELSDRVILTSDNPRSEDPMDIINDMEAGLAPSYKKKYTIQVDRKEAIRMAIDMAAEEDIVLIAGKGHEKYQEIRGVKYDFDDKLMVQDLFKELEK